MAAHSIASHSNGLSLQLQAQVGTGIFTALTFALVRLEI